jgi:hypothetical protein
VVIFEKYSCWTEQDFAQSGNIGAPDALFGYFTDYKSTSKRRLFILQQIIFFTSQSIKTSLEWLGNAK